MTHPDTREPLLDQLQAPRTGPRAAEPPDGSIWISGHALGSEYVLAVPVSLTEGGATLRVRWHDASDTVGLQPLADDGHEQRIALDAPALTATHHLVLLWAPVRTTTAWGARPDAPPLQAPAPGEPLPKHRVEQAIAALWASQRALVERGLIPTAVIWPAPPADPGSPEAPLAATALAFASCQYPASVLDGRAATRSLDRLDARIGAAENGPAINAVLWLGDQIYADASYGLLDLQDPQERYATAYRQWRAALEARPHLKRLDQRNRLFASPDDHEIADNWEPGTNPANPPLMALALEAFAREWGNRGPAGSAERGWWGAVNVGGGHQVFMLDTRTRRDSRPWGPLSPAFTPQLIDAAQREALQTWLLAAHQRDQDSGSVQPKFISSAVWLLPRHTGRRQPDGRTEWTPALSDSWDGYPASLQWLLGLIAGRGIRGVVVLCGDGHLAGHTVARLTSGRHSVELHVLLAPALYAPFPFANAQPHQFATQDTFAWTGDGDEVRCTAESELWPLGDGFVQIAAHPVEREWRIDVTFDTGPHSRQLSWRLG